MPRLANQPPEDYFGDRLERRTLRVGDHERQYVLHVPKRYDAAQPAPLLLVYHGGGGSARFARLATGWSEQAEREGFLVAYPEGLRPHPDQPASFLHNPQFWNVGAGGFVEKMGVDDVAFGSAMLDHITRDFTIDAQRVCATGFSNGASLCFLLGAALGERLALIAPVAGRLWRKDLRPTRPPPLIYITGDQDPLNPINGGLITSPWGRQRVLPPLSESIETWAGWLGCDLGRLVRTTPFPGVSRARYVGESPSATVDYYTVAGAGHVWPGGRPVLAERLVGPSSDRLDATQLIWEALQQPPGGY